MNLNQEIPNNVTITNVGFDLLFSNTNSLIGQEIKVTWQSSNFTSYASAKGSVGEREGRILNFLCCNDINDSLDQGEELDCRECIVDILNFILDANQIANTVKLSDPSMSNIYRSTCLDESYNLPQNYVGVWRGPTSSSSFRLTANGNEIFLLYFSGVNGQTINDINMEADFKAIPHFNNSEQAN